MKHRKHANARARARRSGCARVLTSHLRRKMSNAWWRLALIASLSAASAFDVEGGRPPAFPRPTQPPGALGAGVPGAAPVVAGAEGVGGPRSAVAGVTTSVTNMARRYQAFIAGAAKVSRAISMACGLWLVLGTPFVLLKSGITLRAGDAVMSIYLATFGILMFLVEVPLNQVQKLLQSYVFFLYTKWGRAYFLILAAATSWTLDKVGLLTKVLLVFSASLSTYVMFSSKTDKFADADARARQLASEIGADMKGRAGQAWSIGKMFGISNVLSAAPQQPAAAFGGAGGGQSDAGAVPTWPGSGGDSSGA
tara:strand:- start:1351 stop:2277 length:927 start_codon:yes stop_codon:yes gene_type:complete